MPKRRANGEGNIRKRKDGRWEGRYTAGYDPESGKRIIKNVLGKTQAYPFIRSPAGALRSVVSAPFFLLVGHGVGRRANISASAILFLSFNPCLLIFASFTAWVHAWTRESSRWR